MEVIFALPLILGAVFLLPLTAGWMAKSFGRKFWPWFWLSIPFPIIIHCILICLPERPEDTLKIAGDKEVSNTHFIENRRKAG